MSLPDGWQRPKRPLSPLTDAPRRVHEEAFGLLDSVRFDPAVQPDWPSSG
jgi:hypothetical protein